MPAETITIEEVLETAGNADEYEANVAKFQLDQHLQLKEQAQALFRTVKGLPGAATQERWNALVERAIEDYPSGRFLLERMGAKRYLDPELMAVLMHLRQQLLADIEKPTTIDHLHADSAILAYRHMLRIQGWIDSICLTVERELFGQAPLQEIHGERVGEKIDKQLRKLENDLMPLLHRSQKMLHAALSKLERRSSFQGAGSVSVNRAGQVNINSAVQNNIS
jgi:hypothetical protein